MNQSGLKSHRETGNKGSVSLSFMNQESLGENSFMNESPQQLPPNSRYSFLEQSVVGHHPHPQTGIMNDSIDITSKKSSLTKRTQSTVNQDDRVNVDSLGRLRFLDEQMTMESGGRNANQQNHQQHPRGMLFFMDSL